MPRITENSSVFAGANFTTEFASESSSAFGWHAPVNAGQSYRGSRLSTANGPLPTDRAHDPPRSTEEDEELIEQVQALAKRIGALEAALKDGATPEGGPTSEILAELSSRLANLQEKTVLATSVPPTDDGSAFYDSCAKFAAEASRISRTGRLPFGSDYNKIALTGPGWST